MNRTDTATRRATTAIVAAVALFAAGDSYTHIYDLARQHGEGAVSAALLPLAGDGLVAAASSAILAAARNGKPVPARARVLLFLGSVLPSPRTWPTGSRRALQGPSCRCGPSPATSVAWSC